MATKEDLPLALRSVSQLLRTEDDLDKVTTLKDQLLTEKSAIEIELKSRSQVQIDTILNKLNQLNLCQDEIKNLKQFINDINRISKTSYGSINRFELINQMTKVHEIFDQVTSIVDRIALYNEELQELDEIIESEDYQNVDIDFDVPNLLKIHYKLNNLLNFKDQILEMAKFSSEDSKFIVKRLFTKIDPVVKKFDVLITNIIDGLVESVKIENNSLVIRLCKIIEYEEIEDEKIASTRDVLLDKSNNKSNLTEDTILFEQIINGTIVGRLNERHYKEFFIDKINDSTKDIFKNCWDNFDTEEGKTDELFEILKNLDWVFADLTCVQQSLTKLTPQNWDIFQIYYDSYYKELNLLINKLIEKEPETFYILEILDFEKTFKEIMKNEFGLKQVTTIIGEDSKNKLLDDYLNLIIMKMEEWIANLKKTEQESFKTRLTAPDLDNENHYGLTGSQIVFQIFTQQCDVAAGSGQGKILDGVIKNFGELLIKRQNDWSSIIQGEVVKFIRSENKDPKAKPELDSNGQPIEEEEVPSGLIEYLIALGNDQMRGANYTENYSNKYGSLVSKKYQTSIHENLEKVIDGFADLAKKCCDSLNVLIFNDLKEPFSYILNKKWYSNNDNYSQKISDTIYEYLGMFKDNMDNYLCEVLTDEVLEEVILKYLGNLKTTSLKIKDKEKFIALVKRDFGIFFNLFNQFLDKETIESKFRILEDFLDLTTCEENDDSIYIEIWESLLNNFNDIPLTFFEESLKLKKNLDSSTYKTLVSKAGMKQKAFLQQNQYQLQPSFLGRF